MPSLIQAENLYKAYPSASGPVAVLQGLSLRLEAGETLALTGESGSGKSTFLHLVAGLDQPDQGRVIMAGHDLTTLNEAGLAALRRKHIGFIFQRFNLVAALDVRANIALQARLAGRFEPARAQALAEGLGLAGHLEKYPEQLSGGQQQRVAIARALALNPELIVADEPTGNLDEATAEAVLEEMLTLVRQTGAALLMATHSKQIAARLTRHAHLHRGTLS